MSRVAVSADRRFHRARVKPARKRGRARTWAIAAVKIAVPLAIALFVAYRGVAAIGSASTFRIADIRVHGNHRMSNEAVQAALAELRGTSIMAADLDAWRERLQATPWIREATFKRSLPATIDVAVSEREPIGIGRMDGKLYLIDERGAVIDNYGPEYADFDLPIVDGLQASRTATGDNPRADLAARVIAALRVKPAIAQKLSQVDVSDAHNAAVIVTGDPARIFVGDDRFLARLESYLGLAPALRDRVPDIDYVDLRFDDRIYVRPSGNARSKKVAMNGATGAAALPKTAANQR